MGLHMVCGKALEVKAYTQGGARVKALYSETDLSNFLFRVGQLLPLGYTLPTQTLVTFLSTSNTGLYGSVIRSTQNPTVQPLFWEDTKI